jgi:hypothetical protein
MGNDSIEIAEARMARTSAADCPASCAARHWVMSGIFWYDVSTDKCRFVLISSHAQCALMADS